MCQWFLSHVQKGQAKKVEVIGAFEGLTKTCRLNARDRMLDSYAHMVIEHHLCVPAVTCARAQNLLVIKTNLFLNVREWLCVPLVPQLCYAYSQCKRMVTWLRRVHAFHQTDPVINSKKPSSLFSNQTSKGMETFVCLFFCCSPNFGRVCYSIDLNVETNLTLNKYVECICNHISHELEYYPIVGMEFLFHWLFLQN